jgi:hypothetical protein
MLVHFQAALADGVCRGIEITYSFAGLLGNGMRIVNI